MMKTADGQALLHRIAMFDSPTVTIFVDDVPLQTKQGESVLAALLCYGNYLRRHEVDDSPRAGFCLMGACQDCWVWIDRDKRDRACTTLVAEGMRISTRPPQPFTEP